MSQNKQWWLAKLKPHKDNIFTIWPSTPFNFVHAVWCQQHVGQWQQKEVWKCWTMSSWREHLAAGVLSMSKCLHSTCYGGRAVSQSVSFRFSRHWRLPPSCKDADLIAGWLICTEQKRGTEREKKGWGGWDEENELPCLILQVSTEQSTLFFRLNWLESGWHAKLRTLTGLCTTVNGNAKWQLNCT